MLTPCSRKQDPLHLWTGAHPHWLQRILCVHALNAIACINTVAMQKGRHVLV